VKRRSTRAHATRGQGGKKKRARGTSAPAREHPLVELERTAGNAAVARLLATAVQRQPVATPEAPSQHRLLKVGMTGLDVELAQAKLFVAVGGEVPPDNVFEAKTEDMVRRFQAQKGLGVDGQIGGHTWAALTATTAGRAPADEAELQLFLERKTDADTLRRGGEFAAAEAVYLDLYNQRDIGAILRHGITFSLGTVVQAQGRFDEATSYYQEFINLGSVDPMGLPDATQRLRECRLKQPPGPLESTTSEQAPVNPQDTE
jgi:peptidoglycan hydrolase-like protein with peptidoglycan-binding domain